MATMEDTRSQMLGFWQGLVLALPVPFVLDWLWIFGSVERAISWSWDAVALIAIVGVLLQAKVPRLKEFGRGVVVAAPVSVAVVLVGFAGHGLWSSMT